MLVTDQDTLGRGKGWGFYFMFAKGDGDARVFLVQNRYLTFMTREKRMAEVVHT